MVNWIFWKKSTGLIPQEKDNRDLQYKISGKTITSISLKGLFPKVGNQGMYNSCVGWAVGALMDYYLTYKKDFMLWNDYSFSQAYLWYFGRLRLSKQEDNSGMILRDAFKVITNEGFVQKRDWDFSNGYKNFPNTKARLASQFYKLYLKQLPKYYALNSCEDIDNALTLGYPVVFGFPITKGFNALGSGNQHLNESEGVVSGYHAMLIVGFDEDYYEVRNSWGESWGNRGYCYIKKDLVISDGFDFWTLQ